ncbi:type II secretion system F family protein [Modestobacter sp. I12A-02628]|uniref:Type II secretion system F family protein n=1 Tax=Goekera deserti TaxID=2497753 RepID=A0A7K3WCQ7_9ACTN|nr:type II secretion system F family protein [Goekera deserti]MPQ97584.1 type II secretion system F family protein [Goekera deserti]NDI47812.1 type II secretion system F family protein [Goekera deserti]NEL53560.1 type II secretion system F family protein [Goekera deserti]
MDVVVTSAVLAVVLPLAWLLHRSLRSTGRSTSIARRNLTRGLASTVVAQTGTLESRGTGSGALLRTLTPEVAARRVRRLLDVAGWPQGWTMMRVLWAKVWLGVGVGALAGLWFLGSPGPLSALVLLLAPIGVYHLPELVLSARGKDRQQKIARQLPDVLDQMVISVAAGLGFEAALSRAAANGTGPLAEELTRTVQDISVGRPRREAYEALVRRSHVPDVQRFVGAVNQADAYGVSISDVLRVQAEEMRVKRRQRAEEAAMKVPVKVTFPLMVCILPALLIVVVGPAVMGLSASLG